MVGDSGSTGSSGSIHGGWWMCLIGNSGSSISLVASGHVWLATVALSTGSSISLVAGGRVWLATVFDWPLCQCLSEATPWTLPCFEGNLPSRDRSQ